MFLSRAFIPTLKEAPADAEIMSHKLLIRAGMIRRLTSGVYSYLPAAWRALQKISDIVREEMNRAGAQELLLPMVQPADLWRESGRWEHYGKELLRFVDRHDRECCLGPTHEEVISDLVRRDVKSYRQLPLNLYQIQTKFRDETRPRFGLMRGREFIMKDAYSFDRDNAGADISYRAMFDAYCRVFQRLGLRFRPVEADSGAIGGNFSHEFMVLATTGEDTIAACTQCEYAANMERAEIVCPAAPSQELPPPLAPVSTPDKHTVKDVTAFLNISPERLVKTLIFHADGAPVAALVRGDHDCNEAKLRSFLQADAVRLATQEETRAATGAPVGFAGPVGLDGLRIVADQALALREGWVVGANRADTHLINVSLARDVHSVSYGDIRMAREGDACPRCGGMLEFPRGIEAGHVFKLGLKYSKAMHAVYLDEAGKEQCMVMGCYGIGVSRVLAAALEQNHDANGILFPPPMAPYLVHILCLDPKDSAVAGKARELHDGLIASGVETLLDDRDERPGVKFKDADLLGMPMQLTLGARGLAGGMAETKDRRTGEKGVLPLDDFARSFTVWKDAVLAGWKL